MSAHPTRPAPGPPPDVPAEDAPDRARELPISTELVAGLIRDQCPQFAHLPLRQLRHHGTDHAILRLGDSLVVRLPGVAWAAGTLAKELRWLPRVAAHLPTATPTPVAAGVPGRGYPWPWTIAYWVEGANPVVGRLADPHGLAADLAAFVRAMRSLDPTDAPPTVWPNPLHEEDDRVRELLPRLVRIPGLDSSIDGDAVTAAWGAAVGSAPAPAKRWIHGDLAPGNLLLAPSGRLHGVIDFSAMGLGDPASDLRPAWNLLPAPARSDLRRAVEADDAEWARARGWALLQACAQLAHFSGRNPVLAANAQHVLAEVAAESRAGA